MPTRPLPRFELIAPSTVEVNEPFQPRLRVRKPPVKADWAPSFFLDDPHRVEYGLPRAPAGPFNVSPRGIHYLDNTDVEWSGRLRLDSEPSRDGPITVDIVRTTGPANRRACRAVGEFVYTRAGVYWIEGEEVETHERFTSNPIFVGNSPSGMRLYWGDIHCHSSLTDGLRSPEEVHEFARDESCLDFFSFTEHAEGITDSAWAYSQAAANDYNHSPDFATLVAFEWVSKYGHRNVYYRGDSGTILRSSDHRYDTLSKFWDALEPREALVVPHHSANSRMGVNWGYGYNPDLEPLVEIYSTWGSSEMPAAIGNSRPIRALGGELSGQHVVDALARGFRFGFVGGGDVHDGRPGESLIALQEVPGFDALYIGGLTGAWMPSLSRENLWQALKARHTYATTSRIYASCQVANKTATVVAAASEPIARVVRVTDGDQQTLEVRSSHGKRLVEAVCPLQVGERDRPDFAYFRIETQRDELAWTSPVFLEPKS